jgi:hypothetical protein
MRRAANVPGWLAVLAVTAGGATAAERPEAIAAERLVLATFRYTHPGYWSRLATQISERYRVERSYAWTMRSLGETCVVFRLERNAESAPVVAALRADPRVSIATAARTYRTLGEPAWNDTYAALQPSLDSLGLAAAHRVATGRGVRVAVVDTGVDYRHPDLEGKIVESRDFVDLDLGAFTSDTHGTAVAGVIAAATDNGMGIVGVAPGAEVAALKGCWPDPPGASTSVCNTYTLARALDYAILSGANILNLSLAGPEDPLLTRLLQRAEAVGILVVAAAEDGPELSYPAALPTVLAVRPVSPGLARVPTAHEVTAPGAEVLTTVPGGRFDFFTGSSFAAAHVTGVAALVLEREPELAPQRLRSRLATGSRLDACAALTPAGEPAPCGAVDPPAAPVTPSAAPRSEPDARP